MSKKEILDFGVVGKWKLRALVFFPPRKEKDVVIMKIVIRVKGSLFYSGKEKPGSVLFLQKPGQRAWVAGAVAQVK